MYDHFKARENKYNMQTLVEKKETRSKYRKTVRLAVGNTSIQQIKLPGSTYLLDSNETSDHKRNINRGINK